MNSDTIAPKVMAGAAFVVTAVSWLSYSTLERRFRSRSAPRPDMGAMIAFPIKDTTAYVTRSELSEVRKTQIGMGAGFAAFLGMAAVSALIDLRRKDSTALPPG